MWEIEGTNEFRDWYESLTNEEVARVDTAVEMLIESGPILGRPWVDSIAGSRHHHMKELRPRGGFLRILFCFRSAPQCHPAAWRRQAGSLEGMVRGSDPMG